MKQQIDSFRGLVGTELSTFLEVLEGLFGKLFLMAANVIANTFYSIASGRFTLQKLLRFLDLDIGRLEV